MQITYCNDEWTLTVHGQQITIYADLKITVERIQSAWQLVEVHINNNNHTPINPANKNHAFLIRAAQNWLTTDEADCYFHEQMPEAA